MPEYILMHKNIAVAVLELDNESGFIRKIKSIYAEEHLPVGIHVKKGIADRAALNVWWTDRSIPASRQGIHSALEILGIKDTKTLPARCMGLSLSDQYWIKTEGTDVTWEQVNFFDNPFSSDIGDVLLGNTGKTKGFDFNSPDNTTDGCLVKRWQITDGRRYLIKGGSSPFFQQPFNEVIATEIMQRLGARHIPYTVRWDNRLPFSVCEDFLTKDTELVSAWRIMQTQKKDNNTSVYQHFVNCCNALGINVVPELDRMIVTDYIIANEDRHLNNFGLLRNASTLGWLGFAPIYDSGSSLGYDKEAAQIHIAHNIDCKPFKKHHQEQLKLVSGSGWINFEKLKDAKEVTNAVLSAGRAKDFIDESRRSAISDAVSKRIQILEHAITKNNQFFFRNSTKDDIEKDIAEDYKAKC